MFILIIVIIYILYKDYLKKKQAEQTAPTGVDAITTYTTQPDRTRLYIVGGITLFLYAVSFSWLNFGWYRQYAKSKFHWFDDRHEWKQFDKSGHFFSSYFITCWAYEILRWSGMDNKRAAVTAAFIGFSYVSSIEVWDGFSSKWGASWSDLTANALGVTLAASQYLMWEEQRIMCKYSYKPGTYPSGELSDRADELFGKNFVERTLKDYNNITIWLSVNPSKFIPAIKPDWLCLSVGYGVDNMYGGFENKWTDKEGKQHDRSDLLRKRVFKLSLDADLPRLRKDDPTGKAVFTALNIVKMPFPSYKIKV